MGRPHARRDALRALGATGVAALAGCVGGGGNGDERDGNGNGDGNTTDQPSPTPSNADAVVVVGPGGELRYEPAQLRVDPGAIVAWRWDSGGHTVTVASQPPGSQWRGTNLSAKKAGYVLVHNFEIEGEYEYYCTPHQSDGMTGTVVVGGEASPTATGDGNATGTGTGTGTGAGSPTDGGEDGGGGGGGNY